MAEQQPPTTETAAAATTESGEQDKVSPGVRAARLQAIYAQALGGTLKKLSWANFAGCYPTVARRAEGVLRRVQEQMASQLQMRCENEFAKILENRQVVGKLNELEALVSDAQGAREEAQAAGATEPPTPPHTRPPRSILAAHLHPSLARHRAQLHAQLQATQSQNRLLEGQVREQRAEVEALLARLEDAAADVRAANEALAAAVGALVEETRLDAEHV
ncbi:Nnf1 [Cordyceps militaris CM01]|uniref:Nnf1 n=1 Tax=Cordyceps militaris (strain CM01) TaxID=983644 RepID=G3J7Y3_CORMM|nr:Nnf1 [Cordyceps militaris CM01]EGX97194.1 Nnf1 [Cordyceps militaris CM01]